MFPDTAQFTDPAYTSDDPTADPLLNVDPAAWGSEVSTDPGLGAGSEVAPVSSGFGLSSWFQTAPTEPTGGAASNTPAQGSTTGSKLLGWLGLANNVANTVNSASRTGYTSRPGVNQRPTASLGSFGAVTTTTLLVIIAVFVSVLFLLRK